MTLSVPFSHFYHPLFPPTSLPLSLSLQLSEHLLHYCLRQMSLRDGGLQPHSVLKQS